MDAMGDDVLILIFSRLSMREAVRTSVLSSRYTNIWRQSSKIVTLVDETVVVSPDFILRPPASYIRRMIIQEADRITRTLSVGVCELLRGRTVQHTLAEYPWLNSLTLWRVRGLGPILSLRSDTISSLILEELPRVQGIVLQMPSLVSVSYAGRMVVIGFQPNPPIDLSSASFDFRRNIEEGGVVVARIPGHLADLLQHFGHTRRQFTISTFFSGEMELEHSATVITLDVTHLVLEMTYSHAEDFQGVLSILRRCTDLHSLTIRLLDPAPFQVQVLFLADYFTRREEREDEREEQQEEEEKKRKDSYKVRHISFSFEGVRVAPYMFDQVSSFVRRLTGLQTLTLSSYSEDDRGILYDWVYDWIQDGNFPVMVMTVI